MAVKVSLDGRKYSPDVEARINAAFAEIFQKDAGQEVLNYLTNITMHSPAGPGTSNEVVQHQSGQCWIVGLIRKRTELGKEL
ncbi:MAG: hypothetical protein CBC83_09960 [Flavobacteriales bacterium TMED123]|mgnify:CR=1 FL=1|jgi:hypothetical protein|nr:MAG: hypothetical protein CBC83_09960 [Flavobacteriales bacterium TMED123]|tara:strand:+ start:1018 stop:1263 length:246 start_codon:yes stop_codon:yes gene_type:complete